MDKQRTFLLKEFDKLNAELAKLLEEIRSREKYSLSIIAAVSVWIYTESTKPKTGDPSQISNLIHALSWIPLITTSFYAISVLFLYRNIGWIAEYLVKIENTFIPLDSKAKNLMGWEKHFKKGNKRKLIVRWTWGFWLFQILISIILICLVW